MVNSSPFFQKKTSEITNEANRLEAIRLLLLQLEPARLIILKQTLLILSEVVKEQATMADGKQCSSNSVQTAGTGLGADLVAIVE
jgi:hypothetical protein